jgi:hypothetical protein
VKESLWYRLFRGVRRLRQRADWSQFAGPDWAEHILTAPVTDRLHVKQGRSIARWTLHAGGRQLVVFLKRHYRLPWWQRLLATFHPRGNWSPALQEWEHLLWAACQGLPVPSAAAAGEFIGPWGRFQSFLAVEELAGMLPLHQAVPEAAGRLDPPAFVRWKRGLVAEMVRIVRALHDRHWFHKDLYLCHFYIDEADTKTLPVWPGRVRIIDLHRLGRHPWSRAWWQMKDLAQLLYSTEVAGITPRDRLWFWRLYRDRRPATRAQRWLARLVELKAWNYRRHNRNRRKVLAPPVGERKAA